ncbi:MAG: hypothetical protein RLZ98_1573, partial [Pseudomonadota bacterium]
MTSKPDAGIAIENACPTSKRFIAIIAQKRIEPNQPPTRSAEAPGRSIEAFTAFPVETIRDEQDR